MALLLHFVVIILEAYHSKGLHPGLNSNQVLSFEIEVCCEFPNHLKLNAPGEFSRKMKTEDFMLSSSFKR